MRKNESVEKMYCRWWLGKYIADGRQITNVRWCGPPSGVYGCVELTFDDGKTERVSQPSNGYKPRKKDLNVFTQPLIFKIKAVSETELREQLSDMEEEIKTFNTEEEETNEITLTVERTEWVKSYVQRGCDATGKSDEELAEIFKEELKGMGYFYAEVQVKQ